MKPPQARIQHFKVASQTDLVPVLPLAGVWISRYSSVIICVTSSTLIRCWVFISARSVENYISVERLNTLYTDLQSILQTSINLRLAK